MRRVRLGQWAKIHDGRTESVEDIEKEYWDLIDKLYVTLDKKTVLETFDTNQFKDVDELRAQVARWENGLKFETVHNEVNGKRETYVLLSDIRPCLNASDKVVMDRERSRSPVEVRVDRLRSLQAKTLSVPAQVTCGLPRKKKVARAKRERQRKRKKQLKDVGDSSKFEQDRKQRFVQVTEVDRQALGGMMRQKRCKHSSQKSKTKMVKFGKGKEREDRVQHKMKERERLDIKKNNKTF